MPIWHTGGSKAAMFPESVKSTGSDIIPGTYHLMPNQSRENC